MTPVRPATPAHSGRRTVAVLVRDGVLPMELGLVHQLFGTARSAAGEPLYDVRTCAPRPGRIRTDADFPIYAEHGLEAVAAADTVLVPASHETDEGLRPGGLPEELAEALRTAAAPRTAEEVRGAEGAPGRRPARVPRRIASICTGSFVLAAAGLLDGRRATTHWMSADLFARTFPSVTVDPGVLYVDEGRILTSAGEAAGIDLCLHMIRRDHGAAVAAEVARRTVVPPHREGGQAQYIQRPVESEGLTSTSASRAWALTRLAEPLTLAELAAHDAMSVRTYSRRFREETGLTPIQWLTQRRVDRARELLEQTDHTVDRIATEAGFGTGASLRQHFQAGLGVSPGAYRLTFRGNGRAGERVRT
ncbi:MULTISPECIES: GlxA family transcriptional regulator [unclassified Streptomyces]|uniref:Helix-turn-helix domain-containing protein n=1 Tax=Streptomyces sp. NBC_00119 TaxID=2975659 RepID=A0AAU1UAL2_9ACTN|nr:MULTISPECIES: helix-turn-helix domain-containing protein [unclassified Streptomyces]MCX4645200.1 helix-turn-helix domain-containing protein [Streptomyces sp. NBC_01446]MCX5326032.1 helix-turn-helix domain-containing protein [Streptomyces sp. NBC_00120]